MTLISRFKAYAQLLRPANIVTAIADIWAGFTVSGAAALLFLPNIQEQSFWSILGWLTVSTIGLYGGGVAYNDIFDAKLDAVERPERPIPSGRASKSGAILMASLFLLGGILAAFQAGKLSGYIALAVAACALLYDAWGKHQSIFGPINMGLCRTGNLLLGISAIPAQVTELWPLGLIPLAYVSGITMVSRGEVHGKNKGALYGGLGLYAGIIVTLIVLSFGKGNSGPQAIPFIGLLAYMVFPPLVKAIQKQEPKLIGKSVKAAVISLIILNASLAAAFGGWLYGLVILLLLPISILLAKTFAVT
jgi:4-hydroxybenzoate polyprenyltransferase